MVIRGNRARVGGGLYTDGTAVLSDVVIRGNLAKIGCGLFNTRNAQPLAVAAASPRPVSTSTIVVDHFNGKGAIPTNWKQFALLVSTPGDVVEKLHQLTITDSTGNSAGISSTAKTVPFNPMGVKTTIVAHRSIRSIQNGNAPCFRTHWPGRRTDSPAGYLAAGIDAHGNVFIVSGIAPTPELTPKLIGVAKGYSGKSITLTFTINSMGVEVDGGGFKSGSIPFKDLSNFSLAAAFPNGDPAPGNCAGQRVSRMRRAEERPSGPSKWSRPPPRPCPNPQPPHLEHRARRPGCRRIHLHARRMRVRG